MAANTHSQRAFFLGLYPDFLVTYNLYKNIKNLIPKTSISFGKLKIQYQILGDPAYPPSLCVNYIVLGVCVAIAFGRLRSR